MQKIKWGILGCGRIARKFADDLKLVEDAALFAVGSRNKSTAEAFADAYPAERVYGSYLELASDPDVDIIYVASPHAFHHEHTLLCLAHDKPVLCEKAFAINREQATEMISVARERKVFLMEALWTKFLPHYKKVMEMVRGGQLGEIGSVLVNFGFIPDHPVSPRLFDPSLGGGTMLDIGIYNVFMAMSVLGIPDEIDAWMTPTGQQIDRQCSVVFRYRNGAMASLFSSFTANLPTEAEISGDKGRIRLTTRFYEPTATIEYYPGKIDSKSLIPIEKSTGWGYHHEVRHVHDCLRKGLTESPVMSHADSLALMDVLDRIRGKAGIRYPADRV